MTTVCQRCAYVKDCFWSTQPFVSEAQREMDRLDNSSHREKKKLERDTLLLKHAEEYRVFRKKCQNGGGLRAI